MTATLIAWGITLILTGVGLRIWVNTRKNRFLQSQLEVRAPSSAPISGDAEQEIRAINTQIKKLQRRRADCTDQEDLEQREQARQIDERIYDLEHRLDEIQDWKRKAEQSVRLHENERKTKFQQFEEQIEYEVKARSRRKKARASEPLEDAKNRRSLLKDVEDSDFTDEEKATLRRRILREYEDPETGLAIYKE